MVDSHLVRPKKQQKNQTDQKNNRIVPDMSGRSDVIWKD